jgi:hypothetical protein
MTLTTRLEEYAHSADGRARAARKEAIGLRTAPSSGWDAMDEDNKREARKLTKLAGRWDKRAQKAREGKFTDIPDDEGIWHQAQYLDLHSAAAGEHRLVVLHPDTLEEM